MSLLADLFDGEGLDPGYAAAAARRAEQRAQKRAQKRGDERRTVRASRLFVATVMLGLLGAIAVIQVRRAEPVAQRQREALSSQIRRHTDETGALQRRADGLRSQIEQLRQAALARGNAGLRVHEELNRMAVVAAESPVSGPALVVTVDNAHPRRDASATIQEGGRIYDVDLQGLVNGLWSAGATAIAINGQRLTATMAIRSAGDAILVAYRPLSEPYVVTVLGDPGKIEAAFTDSKSARDLRRLKDTFGIRFDIHTEDRVRLPAAPAQSLRYAQGETKK